MNDCLKNILSKIDFTNSSVLDAGTGRGSAQMLIDCVPQKLTCVAYLGDLRKGGPVQEILDQSKNNNFQLIYADLANKDLFPENSFDYILGHLLIGELKVGKVEGVLANLFYWLKPGGQVFLTDREFYQKFEVKSEIVSMGQIIGNPELVNRSNRDLCELVNLFLSIPKEILLLSQAERHFDYPTTWVDSWLEKVGFKNIQLSIYSSEEKLAEEFNQRLVWAKQRIESLANENLKNGLLQELEKLTVEFAKRKISDQATFLREIFFIQAKK